MAGVLGSWVDRPVSQSVGASNQRLISRRGREIEPGFGHLPIYLALLVLKTVVCWGYRFRAAMLGVGTAAVGERER
jgi:hypothetical protein